MLSIWVRGKDGTQQITHASGPIEIGRGPRQGSIPRAVVPDPTISSNQARVEERADGSVQIDNLSKRVPIMLADGTRIDPGAIATLRPPIRLHIGDKIIEVLTHGAGDSAESSSLRSIAAPFDARDLSRSLSATFLSRDPTSAELTRWFEALVSVQKAAASSPDFFTEVARAVVNLIGLDRGMVLLCNESRWIPVALHARNGIIDETDFSNAILERVRHERLTFFQQDMPTSSSLIGVGAVVAAPIVDENGAVVGAVYGARLKNDAASEIRTIEAQLTQVLAATVAAGLARLGSEADAARSRVQFEQFFTSDLAAELDRDPALLSGREREITALFADIRGFSRISERLQPRVACDLIRDIMELLTGHVREHAGVVVDYQGDGLLAMWNAPVDQPDHAALACRAALAIQAALPSLSRRWRDQVGRELGVGIGINTGPALVGNTGSRIKFKYGPLGHTVNLASRVEGATKQLGATTLLTGATRAQVGEAFSLRRICNARVIGIEEPVSLFELHPAHADQTWMSRRDSYERALELFEQARWGEACHLLFPLLPTRSDAPDAVYDQPTLSLLARTLECLRTHPTPFDPVVELTSK